MPSLTIKSLKSYISNDFNLIISGVHGVGKTAKLNTACEQLNLKMKYFSCSTLDPFTDLVGVPVPKIVDGKDVLVNVRPREIDEAEVIFFDELNRADPKVLNALMEIAQFGSLNGEKLPKLKVVVAAINPVSDEYDTERLDAALLDRFDVFLNAEPEIDLGFFVEKFGDKVGKAAVEYWNRYNTAVVNSARNPRNKVPYLSPRRMEKITATFVAIPSRQTVVDTLPPEITDGSVATELYKALNNAIKPTITSTVGDVNAEVANFINQPISSQRNDIASAKVRNILKNDKISNEDKNRLFQSLATSLRSGKGPGVIAEKFGEAVIQMSPTHRKSMTGNWDSAKTMKLRTEILRIYNVNLSGF